MMKKIASTVFASLLALAVTGCNTVQGVGQDVQKGGEAIERAAEKAK